MQLLLAAVGKVRPGPERDLFEHYRRRMTWSLTVKEVEEKRPLPVAERILREGDLLLAQVPSGAILVTLDERGRQLESPAFAERLGAWRDDGRSHLIFAIGGADGHSDNLRKRADMLLSFGAMTWPHMLVRGMLAEQLYRAECILANHPYHRGRSD
ncbi:23S rRNA (pseudouridine(1915)-N(3))-methyltransferase RlmH [Telmatospirillum siberiense]|uniref:Ribosomal RNA large subunit methyltransferase H n=1 Tax=Telmatospirillum siberiense TaxID=382514 RepID=A0A2N3PV62_9PROT|nr:23S rRNA (pseudouridine(1915)-N(3))-methyltransferase RlmH [Telmatospirillum siberiense]PKU24289.1 23S rRNA (pseudouridine(1915)-N(3))-methyltransferase RlmH [Telmatospirillum siberiense]